jgi:hypothetical protein
MQSPQTLEREYSPGLDRCLTAYFPISIASNPKPSGFVLGRHSRAQDRTNHVPSPEDTIQSWKLGRG